MRTLVVIQSERDLNYSNYIHDLISFDDFLKKEINLSIKEKNINTKINNLNAGLPENGYSLYDFNNNLLNPNLYENNI